MNDADVFVLTDPHGAVLPPAVQATALAKYSRSPLPMREIVAAITPAEAEAFQEKWGVKYGHSSIAELATLPFCFEGVSIVASKVLEKHQRGAYSEKSTRYQEFSAASFVRPATTFPEEFLPVVHRLYDAYDHVLPILRSHVGDKMSRAFEKSPSDPLVPAPTAATIKARAFDAARYLLPAGTGTSLAAVWNARDARYVMNDLLSHPLAECRDIGMKMLDAARRMAPVFGMGVRPTEHRLDILRPRDKTFNEAHPPGQGAVPNVRLLQTPRVLEMGATHQLYQDIELSLFWEVASQCGVLDFTMLAAHMEQRGKEPAPEFFRALSLRFELTMDYGAFRDLQRHRRCTQFVSPLTTNLGYVVPDDLQDAGPVALGHYHRAMKECQETVQKYRIIDPLASQYAIPLGFLHRSIFLMDLQELYYIVELRTQPQGHISYRRIAYQMFEAVREVYPKLMQWCRAIRPESIGAHA